MTWFAVDDRIHSHPKSRTAGLEAMGLWAMGGAYSADFLTDGHVPAWFVDSWPKGKTLAKRLVDAHLWEDHPTGDGWQVLSWTEYQRTREQVLADREAARIRKERMKERRTEQ